MIWVLNDVLIVTLAAEVTTLPVIVYYFGAPLVDLTGHELLHPARPAADHDGRNGDPGGRIGLGAAGARFGSDPLVGF